jgi:hypothetical protein
MAELITDLTRQTQELSAAAALWQYRAMQAEERLAQIEAGPVVGDAHEHAPQDETPGPQRGAPGEATDVTLTKAQDAQGPAWQRWLRRVTGSR